jgi:hypothetical protein
VAAVANSLKVESTKHAAEAGGDDLLFDAELDAARHRKDAAKEAIQSDLRKNDC